MPKMSAHTVFIVAKNVYTQS